MPDGSVWCWARSINTEQKQGRCGTECGNKSKGRSALPTDILLAESENAWSNFVWIPQVGTTKGRFPGVCSKCAELRSSGTPGWRRRRQASSVPSSGELGLSHVKEESVSASAFSQIETYMAHL